MIKHSNKILYIGAGCHIEPVSHLKEIPNFVFIDTQPRNEFDSYTYHFSQIGYRSKFIYKLIDKCSKYGFKLISCIEIDKNYYKKIINWKQYFNFLLRGLPQHINPTLLIFVSKDTGQTINYYISTNILFNMTQRLKEDIISCDGLIISGYHPDKHLIKFIKHPIKFFGYSNTCYDIDRDNSIIYFMQTNPKQLNYYFKDFYMIDYITGTIFKCTDFNDFKTTVELHNIYTKND